MKTEEVNKVIAEVKESEARTKQLNAQSEYTRTETENAKHEQEWKQKEWEQKQESLDLQRMSIEINKRSVHELEVMNSFERNKYADQLKIQMEKLGMEKEQFKSAMEMIGFFEDESGNWNYNKKEDIRRNKDKAAAMRRSKNADMWRQVFANYVLGGMNGMYRLGGDVLNSAMQGATNPIGFMMD